MPDELFTLFISRLLQTVRISIAECAEVAYRSMSLDAAMKMMKFDNERQLREYIEENNEDWEIEGSSIVFQAPIVGRRAEDIPSMNLVSQSIGYAGEMERIV
jgi:26S proteasome regulatory subunit N12